MMAAQREDPDDRSRRGDRHAAITDAGFLPRGAHHEIYLGNPQRSAPERLRTIIRQPFGKE
jgi:hypothetical protein